MDVRLLQPDELEAYRNLRLQALAGDPRAFTSTWERESAYGEADWRRRMGAGPIFVLDVDGLVGMVGIRRMDEESAEVWGVWLHPDWRRRGWSKRMLAEALRWARAQGVTRVELDVDRRQEAAVGLYLSFGFRRVEQGENEDRFQLQLGTLSLAEKARVLAAAANGEHQRALAPIRERLRAGVYPQVQDFEQSLESYSEVLKLLPDSLVQELLKEFEGLRQPRWKRTPLSPPPDEWGEGAGVRLRPLPPSLDGSQFTA